MYPWFYEGLGTMQFFQIRCRLYANFHFDSYIVTTNSLWERLALSTSRFFYISSSCFIQYAILSLLSIFCWKMLKFSLAWFRGLLGAIKCLVNALICASVQYCWKAVRAEISPQGESEHCTADYERVSSWVQQEVWSRGNTPFSGVFQAYCFYCSAFTTW